MRVLQPGDFIGPTHQVVEVLDEAGATAIYRCRHLLRDGDEVVKVLDEELAASPAVREAFRTMAREGEQLAHPNILPLRELLLGGELVAHVLPFSPGQSLAEVLAHRPEPLPRPQALALVAQTAGALAAAHQRGHVHGELTPSRLLLEPDAGGGWRVLLLDFGVSRLRAALRQAGLPSRIPYLHYLAPELLGESPEEPQPAADVYSLGVLLHELLVGHPPVVGDTPAEVRAALSLLAGRPVPLQPADPALAQLVSACLATAPADRPPLGTLRQALARRLGRADSAGPAGDPRPPASPPTTAASPSRPAPTASPPPPAVAASSPRAAATAAPTRPAPTPEDEDEDEDEDEASPAAEAAPTKKGCGCLAGLLGGMLLLAMVFLGLLIYVSAQGGLESTFTEIQELWGGSSGAGEEFVQELDGLLDQTPPAAVEQPAFLAEEIKALQDATRRANQQPSPVEEPPDPPPAAADTPPDSPEDAASAPDLAQVELYQLVHAHRGSIFRCYQTAQRRRPDLEGTLELTLEIGPDGTTTDARAALLPARDAGIEGCIKAQALLWRFPARQEQAPLTLQVPFLLQPTRGD